MSMSESKTGETVILLENQAHPETLVDGVYELRMLHPKRKKLTIMAKDGVLWLLLNEFGLGMSLAICADGCSVAVAGTQTFARAQDMANVNPKLKPDLMALAERCKLTI